jgi:hypothetical protein
LTDTAIQTVPPTQPGEYGYAASRVSAAGNQTFSAACLCPDPAGESGKAGERNAHILVRYALSGELKPRLIAK